MKIKLKKDTIIRILKTLIQVFTSVLVANGFIIPEFNNIDEVKQIVYTIIIMFISSVLCLVMNIEKKEQKGGDISFKEYINSRIGKQIDFDKSYGYQCVDLIDDYIVNYLKLKKGFYGNAKEWVTQYKYSKWLQDNFELTKVKDCNTSIKKGDIGIRTSGEYGHIFIIEKKDNNTIYYYDQNGDNKERGVTACVAPINPYTIDYILRYKQPKKKIFKSNATILNTTNVFASNVKSPDTVIGTVYKDERIKVLSHGSVNSIIQYHINNNKNYKVGIIKNSFVKKDK